MHVEVARLLKHETADVHTRVEQRLRLTDPTLTPDRLADVLERFAGFWAPAERVVDSWAVTHADAAADLRWPRRRRLTHLLDDLALLGRLARVPVEADRPIAAAEHADVLGWFYVSEGSTLGGAVIDRTLRAAGADRPRLRAFTPYPEGPGPMWRAYLAALAGWVGTDGARRDAVVTCARRSFTALEDWLTVSIPDAA